MARFKQKAPTQYKDRERPSRKRESGRRKERKFVRRDSKSGGKPEERTTVTCDSCKKRCEVPFKPSSDKPIYCFDCYKKGSKSNGSGKDYSKGLAGINQKLDKIMKELGID